MQDFRVFIDQPLGPKLLQEPFPVILSHSGFSIPVKDGILHLIVKYSRGNHLFFFLLPSLQLQGRVQIDQKLKLKAVIHRNRVKTGMTGFIIHDFYVNLFLCLRLIDPVNPSLQLHPRLRLKLHTDCLQISRILKGNLKSLGPEASRLNLFMHGPKRTAENPFNPADSIFRPG